MNASLCPQEVRTKMLLGGLDAGSLGARVVAAAGPLLEPEEAADAGGHDQPVEAGP